MIFVRDKGRMCNNILQYGHLYAWGREHGRSTMSMRFAYKYRWFRICHTRYHSFPFYVLAKYAAKWHLLPVADFGLDAPAPDYDEQEQRLLTHRHIVAEGWYARWYDLFLKYKQEIISLFAFAPAVRQAPDRLLASLFPPSTIASPSAPLPVSSYAATSPSVPHPTSSLCSGSAAVPQRPLLLGLHIRRGDYRRWHGGRYFYTDEQYIAVVRRYLMGILELLEQLGRLGQLGQLEQLETLYPICLLVCGNDPDLDEGAFRRALPGITVMFPKGNPAEDLYLLSRCDRLIGAPSTFTLVASMYRDVPLYWIEDPDKAPTDADFGHFDQLFRQIK